MRNSPNESPDGDHSTRALPAPGRFELAGEGLCVGRDSGAAVTDDYPGQRPHRFTGGTIRRVVIDVSGGPYVDLAREADPTPVRRPRTRTRTRTRTSLPADDLPRRPPLRREDLGFLVLELGVGEDALGLELGELFELGDRVTCRCGRWWWRVLLLLLGVLLFLFLFLC